MPNSHATLEDIVLVVVNHLIDMNVTLADELAAVIEGQTERLDVLAESLGELMSSQERLDADVQRANEQLDEVVSLITDLRTEVDALKEQVANGQQVDLSNLDGLVQRISDVVPDPIDGGGETPQP